MSLVSHSHIDFVATACPSSCTHAVHTIALHDINYFLHAHNQTQLWLGLTLYRFMVSGRNPKGIPILSSPYWWYNPISPSKLILNSCVQCKCGNIRGSCGGYMAAQRFQYYKPVRIDDEDILFIYSEV